MIEKQMNPQVCFMTILSDWHSVRSLRTSFLRSSCVPSLPFCNTSIPVRTSKEIRLICRKRSLNRQKTWYRLPSSLSCKQYRKSYFFIASALRSLCYRISFRFHCMLQRNLSRQFR
jgi:hypothetical protein